MGSLEWEGGGVGLVFLRILRSFSLPLSVCFVAVLTSLLVIAGTGARGLWTWIFKCVIEKM